MNRPEAHRTGELGELRATQLFVAYGWIVNKLFSDYGFDLLVQRTSNLVVMGDFALVQVKASRLRRSSATGEYSLVLSAKHILSWASVSIPAFLVLVDIATDDTFLLDCHALVRQISPDKESKGRRYTIRVPRTALVDAELMARLSQLVGDFWRELRALISHAGIGAIEGAKIGAILGTLIGGVIGGGAGALGARRLVNRIKVVSALRSELEMILGADLAERVIRAAIEESTGTHGEAAHAPNTGPQADA